MFAQPVVTAFKEDEAEGVLLEQPAVASEFEPILDHARRYGAEDRGLSRLQANV